MRTMGLGDIDALATCSFLTEDNTTSAMEQLEKAVTSWINEKDEGRRAYAQSSEDFNVGDLALEQKPDLLEPWGVHDLKVRIVDPTNVRKFDERLCTEPPYAEKG
jgi:hypothetical protein